MALTVLVAEDEIIVQKIVKTVVEHCGFECVLAQNGAACLELLNEGLTPALLLLDLAMPIMDGMKVLEQLNKTPREHRFPIAVLSGKNQQEAVKRAISLGADDFIVKPFAAPELTRRLSELVYVADERKIRRLLTNLRVQDSTVLPHLPAIGGRRGAHAVYPLYDGDSSLLIAVPQGAQPETMATAPWEAIITSVAIFRRCAAGLRQVWPRFNPGQVPARKKGA